MSNEQDLIDAAYIKNANRVKNECKKMMNLK